MSVFKNRKRSVLDVHEYRKRRKLTFADHRSRIQGHTLSQSLFIIMDMRLAKAATAARILDAGALVAIERLKFSIRKF